MKKLYIIIIIALLLTAFTACSNNDSKNAQQPTMFSGEGNGDVEFELSVALTETPATAKSYDLIAPVVTNESVTELGLKMGLTGNAGPADKEYIVMSNQKTGEMIRVHTKSGAIEYSYADLSKLFPQGVPVLPSYEEAKIIASEYLLKMGLLPDDVKVGEVVEGGGRGEIVSHLLVRFERKIDGIPVTGPGAKYDVRIGENGEVVMFLLAHREVKALKQEKQIISSARAFDNLAAGKADYVVPMNCAKVKIEKITLAYYLEPLTELQEQLLPVFELKGKCLDNDGNYLEDFTGWVEALDIE